MIGQITKFIGAFMPGTKKANNAVARVEMLRHTEFYQFPRMEFGTETSPNELHLGIRDSLLDAGAKVFDEVLPTPVTNWTMTPVDYVGMHVGCEADYVAFEGSISARKGKPLPSKF